MAPQGYPVQKYEKGFLLKLLVIKIAEMVDKKQIIKYIFIKKVDMLLLFFLLFFGRLPNSLNNISAINVKVLIKSKGKCRLDFKERSINNIAIEKLHKVNIFLSFL